VFIIGIFVQICSGHVWQQFSIGRFISGLGVGALSITIPMVSAFLLSFFFWSCSHLLSIKQRPLLVESVVLLCRNSHFGDSLLD
jgi:hypothetical protein